MFSNYRPAAIELPHARELRTQVNEHAAKDFAEKSSLSSIHDESSSLPEFSMNEIIKGKFLGKGLFGNVYEVQAVNINGKKKLEKVNNQNESPLEKPQEESDDEEVGANATTEQKKAFIASHCIRENKNGRADARFAVKILRSEIKEDVEELYYQAILDMATETKFLSGIRHPNVIKLRGKAAGTPFDDKYFLVLDRLYGVLNDRIETWGRLHRRYTSLAGRQILDRKSEKLSNLWEERVLAAFELSSAMTYLHNRRIIHRDLRPENLGFDMHGGIKLFDFGLARELPSKDQVDEYGCWKMTAATGTPRFMAPEVYFEDHYNETCDVYSFSLLLWQVLSLKTPFENIKMSVFPENVWVGPLKRPPVDPKWPSKIKLLLQQGWSADFLERPPMSTAMEILKQELVWIRDGSNSGLESMEQMERRATDDLLEVDSKSFFERAFSPLKKTPKQANKDVAFDVNADKQQQQRLPPAPFSIDDDYTYAAAAVIDSPSNSQPDYISDIETRIEFARRSRIRSRIAEAKLKVQKERDILKR